jgi:hypothetical protein
MSLFKMLLILIFLILPTPIVFSKSTQDHRSQIIISESPEKVWGLIKDFNRLDWTNAALRVESKVKIKNKKGDIRVVSGPSKFVVKEKLIQYSAKDRFYKYEVIEIKNKKEATDLKIDSNKFVSTLSVEHTPAKTESITDLMSTTVKWHAQINKEWLEKQKNRNEIMLFIIQFYRNSLAALKERSIDVAK